MVIDIVVAVVIFTMVAVLLWIRRPRGAPDDLEQCEKCGKWVPFNKAVIVSEVFTDDAALSGQALGYTGMSASYCKDHAPNVCAT